jgi:hypothetical protein
VSKKKVTVELTDGQYDRLIATFIEYDEVLTDLFEDQSVTAQQVKTFIQMCRIVTQNRWEPSHCLAALEQPDLHGRKRQPA